MTDMISYGNMQRYKSLSWETKNKRKNFLFLMNCMYDEKNCTGKFTRQKVLWRYVLFWKKINLRKNCMFGNLRMGLCTDRWSHLPSMRTTYGDFSVGYFHCITVTHTTYSTIRASIQDTYFKKNFLLSCG